LPPVRPSTVGYAGAARSTVRRPLRLLACLGDPVSKLKVFRVRTDVNHFQYFLPENRSDYPILMDFDGTSKAKSWKPPPVYILKPKHKKGDFFNFGTGYLILSSRARDVLGEFLEMAGELLPLPYKGETYSLLNVTECIDCLDQKKTEFYPDQAPKKYAFHPDRFVESQLFKIPETDKAEILLVEGRDDPEEEFRHIVEANKLQGLIFEQLWKD
jgi:hypothetical protein